MKKAYLYLETGQVLEGVSFGAEGTAMGELVFNTCITGAAETLTDPGCFGQLVVYTFPQLANYGICRADMVSPRAWMGGVVVREFCREPSNFRCEDTVDAFLKARNVVGIAGIDTRMLTQLLRDNGTMNAVITTEEAKPDPEALKAFRITRAAETTSTADTKVFSPEGEARYSVAMVDYGSSRTIADRLVLRGCQVTLFPWNTPAETILNGTFDGVVLSDGPGDPAENAPLAQEVKKLMGKLPLFGIGMGHQLMALAQGGRTLKLKFGHRGASQPVKDLETGKVLITTQNHGYAVDPASLAGTGGTLRYVHINDGSCEGIDYPACRAFSLQFHPEAHGGPLDGPTAFDRFARMMKEGM
ncbi:MAG: glutamine-hydrolyzing carbamoyl-phosphate synthase small subunit [Ruminiclostridium sp.]|nr:glutamine-hydrolyzing carbamoyl-phosphate synthase small subunit [Ruminiclostridium sp.]